MKLSRREFLNLVGCIVGGWAIAMPKPGYLKALEQALLELGDQGEITTLIEAEYSGVNHSSYDYSNQYYPDPLDQDKDIKKMQRETSSSPESRSFLEEIGHFNEISTKSFVFDEGKYSKPKRQLEKSEWDYTNRHLPIRIDSNIINKPGERSAQALKRVVEFISFDNPRYVAAPGERVSLCNIAAWDWSRGLQVHLPHWIGETEMSANMLFRWISHPNAGGKYGEGWQPVPLRAAQLLADRGIPVFALAENPVPRRHGHVALVYPNSNSHGEINNFAGLYFATVTNGRSRGGNGIKNLQNTFRRFSPTYFVHRDDFIVNRGS